MEFQLSSFKSWKMMLWKCCSQYASKFGKLSSGHRSVFIPIWKKGKVKQCSNYHTIALISHSSVLAWRIPGIGEPGGLLSMGLHRVGHDWSDLAAATAHASKVMLQILQARLQQYVNCELPDVQTGFRKGRETRDQIANVWWIIKKAREFQKNIYFCFGDYAKAFDCVDYNKLENSERDGNTRPPYLPPAKAVCRSSNS